MSMRHKGLRYVWDHNVYGPVLAVLGFFCIFGVLVSLIVVLSALIFPGKDPGKAVPTMATTTSTLLLPEIVTISRDPDGDGNYHPDGDLATWHWHGTIDGRECYEAQYKSEVGLWCVGDSPTQR